MVRLSDIYAWHKRLKEAGFTEAQADALTCVCRDMFFAQAPWLQEREDERSAAFSASRAASRPAAH